MSNYAPVNSFFTLGVISERNIEHFSSLDEKKKLIISEKDQIKIFYKKYGWSCYPPECPEVPKSYKCSKTHPYMSVHDSHDIDQYCYNEPECAASSNCYKNYSGSQEGICNYHYSFNELPATDNGYQYHKFTSESSGKNDYDDAYAYCANKCSKNNNCKGFNISSSYKCNYDISKVKGYPKPGKSNVNPNDCWRNVSNQETKINSADSTINMEQNK